MRDERAGYWLLSLDHGNWLRHIVFRYTISGRVLKPRKDRARLNEVRRYNPAYGGVQT